MRKTQYAAIIMMTAATLLLASCQLHEKRSTSESSSDIQLETPDLGTKPHSENLPATSWNLGKLWEEMLKRIEWYGMDIDSLQFDTPLQLVHFEDEESIAELCIDARDKNGKEIYFILHAESNMILSCGNEKSIQRKYYESDAWHTECRFFEYAYVRTGKDTYLSLTMQEIKSLDQILDEEPHKWTVY